MSVHFTEQAVLQIIQKISKQENIRFSYGNFQDLKKKKSIYFKDAKLKYILFRLFENTNIRYMSFSDQIILVEAEKYPRRKFVKGYIVDNETGNPIPYATVMFIKSGEGVIADYLGRFEIELDTKTVDTLKFTSLSYYSKKIHTEKIIEKNAVKIVLKKRQLQLIKLMLELLITKRKSQGTAELQIPVHCILILTAKKWLFSLIMKRK